MRLLSYQTAAGHAAAIQVEDALVPVSTLDAPPTVRELLEALDRDGLRELAARATDADEQIPLAEATLGADPLTGPRNDALEVDLAALIGLVDAGAF